MWPPCVSMSSPLLRTEGHFFAGFRALDNSGWSYLKIFNLITHEGIHILNKCAFVGSGGHHFWRGLHSTPYIWGAYVCHLPILLQVPWGQGFVSHISDSTMLSTQSTSSYQVQASNVWWVNEWTSHFRTPWQSCPVTAKYWENNQKWRNSHSQTIKELANHRPHQEPGCN